MPELPEVETVKLRLTSYIVGHTIRNIEIRLSKIFQGDKACLLGGKIIGVRRIAKVLIIDCDNRYSIVIHSKLTGQLLYRGPNLKDPPTISTKVAGGAPGPHTHVTFVLDNGGCLYYNDIRQFGWIKVVRTSDVEVIPFIKSLGPEPFDGLRADRFEKILLSSSRPIKVVLMDQEKIGGVGNIYTNDALWLSGMNPKQPAKSLSMKEIKKLYEALLTVLTDGLKWGGASELTFVTPDGKDGQYQEHTRVYGKKGDLCIRCKKAKIEKYFLSGRGTYVCPNCQK